MSKPARLLFVLSLLLTQWCFGQTELKTMFYNLLNFSSAPPANRLVTLNSILSTYQPDLFMVCEVESQQDGLNILNEAFRYTSSNIAQAPFLFNTSGASLIHQLVYYDTNKLTLDYTDQIETNVRSINHYSFSLNTESSTKLEVFVAHFKASRGEVNENERFFEAQQFINYIQNFPSDTNLLLAGDFNVYSADEPAYQTLLNGTANLSLVDPVNTSGDWNNNSNFSEVHTQSTRQSNIGFDDFGAGGGLDDRFDFILMSEALLSEVNKVSYVESSYKILGNNGNCFNNAINSLDCDGEYDSQLREWLYQMSDHLPVVMELEIDEDLLSSTQFVMDNTPVISGATLIKDRLNLRFTVNHKSKKVKVYNTLGQEMTSFDVSDLKYSLDVSTFANGLYFLVLEDIPNNERFYIYH